jgi:hypothetical protein
VFFLSSFWFIWLLHAFFSSFTGFLLSFSFFSTCVLFPDSMGFFIVISGFPSFVDEHGSLAEWPLINEDFLPHLQGWSMLLMKMLLFLLL